MLCEARSVKQDVPHIPTGVIPRTVTP
jgi:hypothetical protein